MTKVISETRTLATDENSKPPPAKKICLSSSKRSHACPTYLSPKKYSQPMANSHDLGAVVNGYSLPESLHHYPHHHHNHVRNSSSPDESSNSDNAPAPVATLSNLGNTCFLNSVLYTLRFAPSFLHNLHHLVKDLAEISGRQPSVKVKSSSLGRSTGSNNKSWSSKDLPSLNMTDTDTKIAAATERLHELYESLYNSEQKDHTEPFQPEVFLQSLRDVNPIFEGNQQHDAHELLVCLIDNIRETCRQLTKYHETRQAKAEQLNNFSSLNSLPFEAQQAPINKMPFSLKNMKNSLKFRSKNKNNIVNSKKSKYSSSNGKGVLIEKQNLPPNVESKLERVMNGDVNSSDASLSLNSDSSDFASPTCTPDPKLSHNFIADDFQGVSVQCTKCLECEKVTERKETFCDICVPIIKYEAKDHLENISKLYHDSIVMDEFLVDSNKYWCEQCCRYNEAKRYVEYETLPRLLTLQLKRFSSGFNSGVEKVNDYMPTPFKLDCFCKDCSEISSNRDKLHHYELYGVIMHLGATIASGHYVAYVRACDSSNSTDLENCSRDKKKTSSLSGSNLSNSTPSSIFTAPQEKQTRIMKFFKSSNKTPLSQNQGNAMYNESVKNHLSSRFNNCSSLDCCSIRFRNDSIFSMNIENCYSSYDSVWLECDDDTVRTLSKKDFEEVLEMKSAKNLASTPYLLFYVQVIKNVPAEQT